jgi:hypothetical protein
VDLAGLWHFPRYWELVWTCCNNRSYAIPGGGGVRLTYVLTCSVTSRDLSEITVGD